MDVMYASEYGITVVDSTDDNGVHKGENGDPSSLLSCCNYPLA